MNPQRGVIEGHGAGGPAIAVKCRREGWRRHPGSGDEKQPAPQNAGGATISARVSFFRYVGN